MAKQLNVDMRFTADTSKVKQSINELQQAIQKLGYGSMPKNAGIDPALYKKAAENARELAYHLNAAYNTKTGNLDLSRLSASLKQSGTSLNQLTANFHNAGAAGQQAFTTLARSIAAADQPTISVNEHLSTMFTTLKNVARFQISSSIMHGLIGGIQTAYNYAQDLNASLNNIRIVTGASVDQMARFADYANKTARQLSATTLDYTNASLIYYQQGLNDQQVKERTDVTIKMANVVRESAETVSEQLTAIWNNFDDGSKSLEYYADVITALGAATASSSSEISAGLNKFAAVADTVGLSYENATAALATITATTRQSADTVGTGLRTLFSRLQGLSLGDTLEDGVNLNKYSQALAKVGVQALDSSGNLRRMDEVLEDLGARWGDLSKAQQTALAQTVGGVRQYTTLVALMDNWDFMKENQQIAAGAEGTLQNQADIYAESWEAAQKRVKAATESLYQDLIKDDFFITLNKGLEHLLVGVDAFIDKFGGLKSVLIGLGSFVLSMVADKIGPAVAGVVQNIQVMVGGSQKVYERMQQSFSSLINAEVNRKTTINNEATAGKDLSVNVYNQESQAELATTEALVSAKTKLSIVGSQLSAQERAQADLAIQGIQVQIEQNKKLGAELDNLKNKVVELALSYQKEEETATKNLENRQKDVQKQLDENLNSKLRGIQGKAYNKYGLDPGNNIPGYLNDTKQQVAELGQEINTKLIQYISGANNSLGKFGDVFKNKLNSINIDVNNINLGKAQLESFQASIKGIVDNNSELQASFERAFRADTPAAFSQEVRNIFSQLENLEMSSSAVTAQLRAMGLPQSVITDFENLNQKVQQLKETNATLGQEGGIENIIKQLYDAVDAEQTLEGKTNAIDRLLNGWNLNPDLKNQLREVTNQHIKLGDAVRQAVEHSKQLTFAHVVSGSEAITTLASSLGMVATVLNSIKSISSAIQNPDLSGWEKFSTIAMGLSMSIPTMIRLFTSLGKVQTFLNQTILASITGLKKEAVAEKVSAVAKELSAGASLKEAIQRVFNIEKIELENKSLKTNILLRTIQKAGILAVIGAFAALALITVGVIAGIKALSNVYNADKIAAEKAAKAAEELAQAANEAKSAAENLKSTIDSYDSAVKKLEECKKGTEEWRDALKEVNSTAIDVLNTIGNNLSADDLTALRKSYYKEGQFDPKLLAKAQQIADQQALEAQYAASFADYNASMLKVASQRTNLARNIGYRTDVDGNSIAGIGGANYVKSLLKDYSEELSNLDLNGFHDRLEELGIDLSNISKTTLQDWQAQIQSMGDQAARAAEKMALIAQVQVSEYLGDSATDAEKAYTATELNAFAQEREDTWLSYLTSNENKRRYEIYDENGQSITRYGGISQSSGVNNIVYQDALKALQAAGYNWNAATKNAVVGNDTHRFLAFTINGERKEISAEEIAHMIAADEAFKYSVDESVEKYRDVRSNVETSQGQALLDQLVLGYNANTKSFNFADYTTGLNKKNFDNLINSLDSDEDFFNQLGLSIEDLQAFTSLYGIEFKDFINSLQDQIKNTAKDWSILDNIPLISPDVADSISLDAAQILYQNFKDIQLGPLGEQSGTDYIAGLNMILSKAKPEDYNDIINDFLNIDFSTEGAPEQLKQILLDYGIVIQDDDIRLQYFITRMQQAAGYFPEIVNLQEKISGGLSIIDKLKFGNAISDKDYEQLMQYTDGWEQFFSLQADGTHKFIGNQQELRKEFLKTIEVERKQFDNFQELQKETAESMTPILSGGMKSSTSEISKMLDDTNFQNVLSAKGYDNLDVVRDIIKDYENAIIAEDQDSEDVKQAIARYQELWDRLVEFYGNDYEQARKELAQIEANSASTLLDLNYGTYFDSNGNNITKFSDLTKEDQEAYTNRWNELISTEMADAKTLGEAQQIFSRNSQLHLEGFEVPDLSKMTNYSDILISVANNYKSCADEALKYQKVILSGSKEEIKAAEDSLKLAIAIEEVTAAANDGSVIVSDYGKFLQAVLANGQGYTDASDKLLFLKDLAADMHFNIDDSALESLIPTLDTLSTTITITTGAFQQMEQRLSSISSTIKNLDFGSIISNEDYQKIKAFVDEMQRLGILAARGIDIDSLFLAQADGSQKFIGDQKQLHELLKSNLDYEQEINNKTKQFRDDFSSDIFTNLNIKDPVTLLEDDLSLLEDILIGSGFKSEDIAKFFAGELEDETLFNNIKNTILNFWIANLEEIDQNLQERRISLARNFTELNDIFNGEGGGNLKAYSQQWKVLTTEALGSAKTLTEVTSIINQANAGAADFNDGLQLTDNIAKLNATDLKAYTDALLTVADGYESCKNEAMALQVATDETRQQAADTLSFAIAIEEVNSGMYQGTTTANKYAKAVEDIVRSGEFTKENIAEILKEYGLEDIVISDEFIRQLEEMKDIVLKIDPVFARLKDSLKDIADLTHDLDFGSLISEEDYQRLAKYVDNIERLFQLQTNGQYKFIGTAEDVAGLDQEYVNQSRDELTNAQIAQSHLTDIYRGNANDRAQVLQSRKVPFFLTDDILSHVGESGQYTRAILEDTLKTLREGTEEEQQAAQKQWETFVSALDEFATKKWDTETSQLYDMQASLAGSFEELVEFQRNNLIGNGTAFIKEWQDSLREGIQNASTLSELDSTFYNAGQAREEAIGMGINGEELSIDNTMLSDKYLSLASAYENCTDEATAYDQALKNLSQSTDALDSVERKRLEGQVAATEENLLASIYAGELAKQYSLDAKAIESYAERIQDLKPDLKATRMELIEMAKDQLRFDKAVESAEKNLSDWSKSLGKLDASQLSELREAYGDLLDIDGDSLSDKFLNSAHNLMLMQQAIQGSEEAYDELQAAARQELYIKLNLSQEQIANIENYIADIQVPTLEVGATIDDGDLYNALNGIINACASTAAEATSLLSEMGYDAEVITDTNTQPPETVGYDLIPTPGEVTKSFKPTGSIGEPLEATFPSVTYEARPVPAPDGKTTTATALKIKPGSLAKASGGNIKHTNSSSTGGGGKKSGGGGGKSSTKSKKEPVDTGDRYHAVREQLADLKEEYENLAKAQDRAFGKQRIEIMEKINENLHKTLDTQDRYLQEIRANLEKDTAALENMGSRLGIKIEYDENGVITNYDDLRQAIRDEYNKAVDDYNAGKITDEGFEDVEKRFEESEKAVDLYEESLNLLSKEQLEFLNIQNEIEDNSREIIEYKVEYKIELNDDELKYLDFLLQQLDNDAYDVAEALGLLGKEADENLDKIKTYSTGLDESLSRKLSPELMEKFYNGELSIDDLAGVADFTADDIEDIRSWEDAIMSADKALQDARKTVEDKFMSSMQQLEEEVDDAAERFENLTSVLDHYRNIIDIVGKDQLGITDDILKGLTDVQINIGVDQVEESLKKVQAFQNTYDNIVKILSDSTLPESERKYWEDRQKDVQKALDEAQEEYLSNFENAVQAIFDGYTQVLERAINKFLENSGLADSIGRLKDFISSVDDENVSNVTKTYELTKLTRDIQKSMDESPNVKNKRSLLELQNKINAAMRDGEKYSQAQLDILRKEYELKMARIALDEMEQAKSTVRMSRDNEGNWSYVYVADEDQMQAAEDELQTKIYEYNQLVEESYRELIDLSQQMTQDWSDQYKEIMTDTTLSDEERQRQLELLNEKYKEGLDDLNAKQTWMVEAADVLNEEEYRSRAEAINIITDGDAHLQQVFDDTAWAQAAAVENMTATLTDFEINAELVIDAGAEAWKEYQANLEEVMEAAGTSVNNFSNTVTERTDEISTESEVVKESVDQLTESLKNEMEAITEYISKWQQDYVKAIEDIVNSNTKLIESCKDLIKMLTEANKISYETTNNNNSSGGNSGNSGGANRADPTANYNNSSSGGVGSSGGGNGGSSNGSEKNNLTDPKKVSKRSSGQDSDTGQKTIKKKKDIVGMLLGGVGVYDTGGYTGDWNSSEGRLAVLHQKEQVFNAEDTEKLLDAAILLHTLDMSISDMAFGLGELVSGSVPDQTETVEQDVHITAEFPNVTNHSEIEEAFNNLIGKAAQFANRKR